MTYAEWKKDYSWMIKKYPGTDRIYGRNMEEKLGTQYRIEYAKVGSRWKLVRKQTESFNRIQYANTLDAVPFFRGLGGRETVTCGYCKLAYLPLEIVSLSPDRSVKVVRQFVFD